MLQRPIGFLVGLPLVVILSACCSGEFTQDGTGKAPWGNVNNPPTQQEITQACVVAKANASELAKTKCTEKYPNCKGVSADTCITTTDAAGQTVNATVTGHFKCCDK